MKEKNQVFEPACFYLRKSREDQEAEQQGAGETLAKHRKALIKLSQQYGINVKTTFEEVVSGESIIHRPKMLELLKEVEDGKWKAVFCMDIDRLGRGGMRDQGLILDTFKTARTLIITPRKVYDLNDEMDEEYTEFEAFMARKELKIINRRLQSGRRRSVEDGNYIATIPPYGYDINTKDRRRYLVKNPQQEECVKLIYELYQQGLGGNKIAAYLNSLGFKSYTGIDWQNSAILNILKNPVYAGVIVWGKHLEVKSSEPGKKKTRSKRPRSEQIWIYDAHEAYISIDKFQEIQEIIKERSHPPYFKSLTNPLAVILKCACCGLKMSYRPYKDRSPHLVCCNTKCKNKSARFDYVEEELIRHLENWINEYKSNLNINIESNDKMSTLPIKKKGLLKVKHQLDDLLKQKNNLHDLLEQGIYDTTTFIERSKMLAIRINKANDQIEELETAITKMIETEKAQRDIIPQVERVIKVYHLLKSAEDKNKLLKSIIDHVDYKKELCQKGKEFTLTLYPRLLGK